MIERPHYFAAALLLAIFGLFLATGPASTQTNVLFIFDASGSMNKKVDGKPRIDIARSTLITTVLGLPASTRVGLMMFGARRAKDCSDIQMVSPAPANDRDTVVLSMAGLRAKGETPIADSIMRGAAAFKSVAGQSNTIVVLTDGIEECNGDPCAAAAAVSQMGVNLKIHLVGFTLGPTERRAIECVPRLTGGQYYEASDAKGLEKALADIGQVVASPPPPKPAPPSPAPQNYKFRSFAYLAPDKPYHATAGVRWTAFRLKDGIREDQPVFTTSTLSNSYNQDLAPGDYVVQAAVGLASGEAQVRVTGTQEATASVMLQAGVIDAVARASPDLDVAGEQAHRVRWDIADAAGHSAGTYGSSYQVTVPAGRWTLRAALGNATATVPVDVAEGSEQPVRVVLDVGRLVLNAKNGTGVFLSGAAFEVTRTSDNSAVYGEMLAGASNYNLAAGTYHVVATYQGASSEMSIEVSAGRTIEQSFTFP